MRRSVIVFLAVIFLGIPAISPAVDCGDVNNDSLINVQDIAAIAEYVFVGSPQIPLEIGDVDNCGSINMSDISYLISYLAYGGNPPCMGDVPCGQPANGNHIDVECTVDIVSGTSGRASLPIYITTEVELSALSLSLEYYGDNIELDSVDFTGSVCPVEVASFIHRTIPDNKAVLMGWLGFGEPVPVQSGGLLATLLFSIAPDTPPQTVDIFMTSIDPGFENILSPRAGGEIFPDYFDCGSEDLKIIFCGDANSDGAVNVFDITHIISFLYLEGPLPEVPETADVNNDSVANIFDVATLISYLYLEGPELNCP